MGKIGVTFVDDPAYHPPDRTDNSDETNRHSYGRIRKMSVLTQNVDGLHRKAGTKHIVELHGRNDRVRCTSCGTYRSRYDFHDELEETNPHWLLENVWETNPDDAGSNEGKKRLLRPDGDADTPPTQSSDYSTIHVPPCRACGSGFVKPDVVFFGDVVPRHTVDLCNGAVRVADGLLCIGSSLAVLSAFWFVQRASEEGVDICVLNVGETRAEVRGMDVTKLEVPAGQTLEGLVRCFENGGGGCGGGGGRGTR